MCAGGLFPTPATTAIMDSMPPLPQPPYSARPTSPWRTRVREPAVLLAGLVLSGLAPPGAAELYRWVDETGTTVYSQAPPPPGTTSATAIAPPKPPPTAVQPSAEQLRSTVEQDFDRREEQARQAEETAKKAAEQATRQANCNAARTNLETLESHGRGRIRTPDGRDRFLSRDELATFQEEARKQIRDNCD